MPFPEAPLFHQLREVYLDTPPPRDERPMAGAMAPFVGPRHASEEIYEEDTYSEDDRPLLEAVRAFPVRALVGATLTAPSQSALAGALHALLGVRCPGIAWELPSVSSGPIQKYQILHTSIPAPPDEATGGPMAIEVYGRVVQIGALRLESEEGRKWIDQRRSAVDKSKLPLDERYPPLEGALVIEIAAATYASIRFPGVGVPVYA